MITLHSRPTHLSSTITTHVPDVLQEALAPLLLLDVVPDDGAIELALIHAAVHWKGPDALHVTVPVVDNPRPQPARVMENMAQTW